jgi:hypothetical protein
MVHYSSIEYITLLEYSVLMPLSGTITSADPILVSTLPGTIYRCTATLRRLTRLLLYTETLFFIRILV